MRQRTFFMIGILLILGAVFAAVAVAQSTGTEKSRSAPEMMEGMKGNIIESCTSTMMESTKGNMKEACTTGMMEHMDDKSDATVSNHCGGAGSMMGASMMGNGRIM